MRRATTGRGGRFPKKKLGGSTNCLKFERTTPRLSGKTTTEDEERTGAAAGN